MKRYEEILYNCMKYLYSQSGFAEQADKYAKSAVDFMNGKSKLIQDINVRILKGGSYKIKDYYLENNNLQDIRGASVLLTHIEEELIPQLISEKFSKDCKIYNGGGNIFALVPANADKNFALALEKESQKYLISANIAYCISDEISIEQLLGNDYKRIISENENALNERKKIKVIDSIEAISEIDAVDIKNDNSSDVHVEIQKMPVNSKEYCQNCRKRIAFYRKDDEYICAACLHKNSVGAKVKNEKYIEEYKDYNKNTFPEAVNSLKDIDEKHIAVVYGDGNNMGGIIHSLKKITEMMRFSETVKSAANKSVFEAMGSAGIKRFEVVGLGGDDVFVIVPADKAILFSIYLIKNYYEYFEKAYPDTVSTMSVGIAIAKTSTPVKIMLEAAEEELAKAKSLSKKSDKDKGSLSFTILDSYNNEKISDDLKIKNTLLPYTVETAENIMKYVKNMNGTSKSRLRNLSDAFANAESPEEASLFFKYLNAKNSDNQIILPNIHGFEKRKEYDGYYFAKNSDTYFYIWDDLLDVSAYSEGGDTDESRI